MDIEIRIFVLSGFLPANVEIKLESAAANGRPSGCSKKPNNTIDTRITTKLLVSNLIGVPCLKKAGIATKSPKTISSIPIVVGKKTGSHLF